MIAFNLFDLIPDESCELVKPLVSKDSLEIKVVNVRKTKHGDFKKLKNGFNQITLNHINNKYRFLITLIHEITHLYVYKLFKNTVKPHGLEWKNQFRILISPVLNPDIFPKLLLPLLANYFKNPKASTDSDIELVKELKSYDLNEDKNYIYELDLGREFSIYNGKIFKLEKKLRKRYKCLEIETGKYYLFNANAEINITN